MKFTALISVFILASVFASAQVILVTKKDSTQFETRLNASTSAELFVSEGRIPMDSIRSVGFTLFSEGRSKLYTDLRRHGVVVSFDYKKGAISTSSAVVAKSPVMVAEREPVSLDQVVISLDNFNKERRTAKTLQLVGMLALGGSAILQSIYNQEYSDDYAKYLTSGGSAPEQKVVPSAIPIAGTILFTVGIGIDLSASKHLKLVVFKK